MSIYLNGQVVSGGGQTEIQDSETIVNNESSGLDAVGIKTKDGSVLYDWVGTKEEYEAGIADGSISEDWICWVTDEEGSDKYRSMPIGSVFSVMASENYVPDGCLPCDGAEYSKTQFKQLWDTYLTGELETVSTFMPIEGITKNGKSYVFDFTTLSTDANLTIAFNFTTGNDVNSEQVLFSLDGQPIVLSGGVINYTGTFDSNEDEIFSITVSPDTTYSVEYGSGAGGFEFKIDDNRLLGFGSIDNISSLVAGSASFKGSFDLSNGFYNSAVTDYRDLPLVETVTETKMKTLLNTCTYSEYQQALDTYGQCGKFAVGSKICPIVSNASLTANGNYTGNVNDSLVYKFTQTWISSNSELVVVPDGSYKGDPIISTYLGETLEIGSSCINTNGVISNFSTSYSGYMSWNVEPAEFVIKINTGDDIDTIQGIFGNDVSVCIKGGRLGCNSQNDEGRFVSKVQISQNQDIWIKCIANSYHDGEAFYSFTGASDSYVSISGSSDLYTGGTNFGNWNIGCGYVGGSEYPFLGTVDLNESTWTDSEGSVHSMLSTWHPELKSVGITVEGTPQVGDQIGIEYSAKWYQGSTIIVPSDYGISITGTPQEGDTISFEEKAVFRVPLLKDGAVIQQAMTADELGKSYNAGLPNLDLTNEEAVTVQSGAVVNAKTGSVQIGGSKIGSGGGTSAYTSTSVVGFNLDQNSVFTEVSAVSSKNSIYGNSDTVQMNAIALRYFVVVANGTVNQSQMDWSEWSSNLSSKVDKSSLAECAVVVKVSDRSIAPSWYRIWSDGWVEQGGRIASATSQTVELLIEMADINYCLTFGAYATTSTDTEGWDMLPGSSDYTTTSFRVSSVAGRNDNWKVEGYKKE